MEDKDRKEQLEREGVKYDGGKLRYDLIPPDALEQLAAIYTMGAQKYDEHNWRNGMKWSRIFGALMRHAWSWFAGQDIDPESGLNHMAHAAWNCFTLITYSRIRPEFDDRIKDTESKSEKFDTFNDITKNFIEHKDTYKYVSELKEAGLIGEIEC